jgi:hypothetical protein
MVHWMSSNLQWKMINCKYINTDLNNARTNYKFSGVNPILDTEDQTRTMKTKIWINKC